MAPDFIRLYKSKMLRLEVVACMPKKGQCSHHPLSKGTKTLYSRGYSEVNSAGQYSAGIKLRPTAD